MVSQEPHLCSEAVKVAESQSPRGRQGREGCGQPTRLSRYRLDWQSLSAAQGSLFKSNLSFPDVANEPQRGGRL